MKTAQYQILHAYYAAILPYCNTQKVQALLAKLGYKVKSNVTADDCMTATTECGQAFTQPFGNIADIALASPKYEAYKLTQKNGAAVRRVNKCNGICPATGDEEGKNKSTLTDEQKIQIAQSTLDTITSWFKTGYDFYSTSQNAEANKLNAQAQLIAAQNQSNNDSAKNSSQLLKWGLVGLAAVLAAVVIIVIVKNNKK